MRVTVLPIERPSSGFTLTDAGPRNDWVRQGDVFALEEQPDGLIGWYEPAMPRDPDIPDLPRQHGQFWPEALYLSNRVFTIRGWHKANYTEGSSLSAAVFRDSLAAMVGESVRVTVEDNTGAREVTGYVANPPTIKHTRNDVTDFSIIVSCPDPLKYGPRSDFPVSGSSVSVVNAGTGLVAPVFTVSSPVTVLDVQLGDAHVRWEGSASSLVLDLAEGRPLGPAGQETGSLVYADLLRVPPGEHVLSVECDGDLTVSVRSGWK